MWPRNLMVSTEKTHFSLSVTPASCILSSTDHSRSSCSCWLLPLMRTSSMLTITPGGQDMSHFPVEDFRPGTDSKRKSFETVSPEWHDECSQFLRLFMQWDLIKHFGTRELCKKLISRGKGEVLTSNAVVEFCEIYADSHFAIWLGHHHNGCAPLSRIFDGAYDVFLLHTFQFFLHFLSHWQRQSTRSCNRKWLCMVLHHDFVYWFQLSKTFEQLWKLILDIVLVRASLRL